VDQLNEFEGYCKEELPNVLQEHLEARLNPQIANIPERIRMDLDRIVRVSLAQCLISYHASHGTSEVSTSPSTTSNITKETATSALDIQLIVSSSTQHTILNELEYASKAI
jgi:hypothetical protein